MIVLWGILFLLIVKYRHVPFDIAFRKKPDLELKDFDGLDYEPPPKKKHLRRVK